MSILVAIGWSVLHSLWQISLIFVAAHLISTFFRGREHTRYAIALLALAASLACALYTGILYFDPTDTTGNTLALPSAFSGSAMIADAPVMNTNEAIVPPSAFDFTTYIPWVGMVWGIGALLLCLRALGAYWLTHQLRRMANPIEDNFQQQCNQLAKRMGIQWRPVQWMQSGQITEPLTLGWWRPVVLFPIGMHLQLQPSEVEALLLHELAHIRRHDYLINLFQILVETLFFYHPLIWILSREVRVRREYCCDDMVVQLGSNRLLYARTLTALQLATTHSLNIFAMKATGKSLFTTRMLRIAGITPQESPRVNVALLLLLLGSLTAALIWPAASNALPEALQTIAAPLMTTDTVAPVTKTVAPNGSQKRTPKPTPAAQQEPPAPTPLPTPAVSVAVEAEKMNVFYVGVDNPVLISVSQNPDNEPITAKLTKLGTIVQLADGRFIAQLTQPGQTEVQVFVGNRLVATKPYRVKRIPDPMPTLGGMNSSTITKAELLSKSNIIAMLQNFDFDGNCQVISYSIVILPAGGVPSASMVVQGSAIPAAVTTQFKELKGENDCVFIEDIKVKCVGDANSRNIGGLVFKINK